VSVHVHHLPVPTDTPHRLGRHVRHDDRSLDFAFPVPESFTAPSPITTMWSTSAPVLNQLKTSACTGNALAQMLDCDLFAPVRAAKDQHYLSEEAALHFYSVATHISNPESQWYPPHDDGSDGLAVAQAAQQLGYVDRYLHCFTWPQVQAALATQPVIFGTIWTKVMFSCASTGFVSPGPISEATIAGGHELMIRGINYEESFLVLRNSWGSGWGGGPDILPGEFKLSFADFQVLLALEGDVVAPHGLGLP
jgi:hypothetical protein